MLEFIDALGRYAFLRNALLVGILASVSCGVVGTYVVARRITYIAGGISHFVLGGMGLVRYLSVVYGWDWLHPLHGAIVSALLAAVIIGLVSLRAKQREDTIIGALWAIGMAAGVLFVSRTPGYNEDLMSYLFGRNILLVSRGDLWLIVALDVLIVACGVLFYNQLLAVCFDEEFARLRNINVEAYYLLLLCLTALTVVLMVMVVGIVMTIALLTLPAAVAGFLSRTLWQMMALATLLCALFTVTGLALSYGPRLPAGATIVVIAGATYLIALAGRMFWNRLQHRRAASDAE